MAKKWLALLMALVMVLASVSVAPFTLSAATTAGLSFNFQNNDQAYTTHAGFECIAFPACGWGAINNISAEVIEHNVPKDLTVELDYFWTDKSANGWLTCRSNTIGGTDDTSVNTTLAASTVTANRWSKWTIDLKSAYLGTRADTTDLFFSFGGSGDKVYIRSIKVYETGKPDSYASFDPKTAQDGETIIRYPFQDTSLSFEERAADLVSRMTLEEKLTQFGSNNIAISRLGVEHYNYWRECLHGVARMHEDSRVAEADKKVTSFPYSINMGASWNPALIQAIGSATSDEARGFDNKYNMGLNYFSPTINLYRDPRWGRSNESYSEDAFLTSLIGEGFVNGLQGDDDVYNKINATIKHYALNNSEFNREHGNSEADNRTVLELYTRAFKYICLNTDISSVMSSYNRVNGVPASANRYLLTDLLRERWGLGGFVVSDCGAVADIFETNRHHWQPTEEEISRSAISWDQISDFTNASGYVTPAGGVALALMAGLDLNCGFAYEQYLADALEQGLITENDVDVALTRIFTSRFQTGEFDPDSMVPYKSDEYSLENQRESEAHRQLAEDAADEGVVLLKNDNHALPLDASKVNNIVLVGENVNQVILGDYSGISADAYSSTPNEGVTNLLKELNPNAKVTCIDTYDAASTQYFGNIGYLKITYTDGKVKTLQPKDSTEQYSCQVESPTNFGYVYGGGYAKFPDVYTKDIQSIEITTSGKAEQCSHGIVEVHLNAPDGLLLASVDSTATTGWGDYRPHSTEKIGSNGGYDTADLYIVFKSASAYELTEADNTAIQNADVVLACVGTVSADSGEGHDRDSLDLPRGQAAFIKQMTALNDNVIVYMQTISMVNVEDFKDKVDAILWTSYNGQAQGNALARILFGKANPSAKLPFTWYQKESQLPDIADYTIRGSEDSYGRTYQYFSGDVSYEFGYGLSYTDFVYSDVQVSKSAVTPDDTITLTLNVKNTGKMDGMEVVQVYAVSPHADGIDRPFKELKGFAKVNVKAGETEKVTIELPVADWYFCDETTGVQEYDAGNWTLQVGASSADIRAEKTVALSGDLTPALQTVTLKAEQIVISTAEDGDHDMTARLTAALNNDAPLDLTRDDVTVVYKSSNDLIATVDANGIVTANAAGVCTITAEVTYAGVTMSDSYPVVVQGEAKFAQGTLNNGDVSVTGSVPVGGSLRVTDLKPETYFYEELAFEARSNAGVDSLSYFWAIGLEVLWNYEAVVYDEPVHVEIKLPAGQNVTAMYAMNPLYAEILPVDFELKDGVLSFDVDCTSYYGIADTSALIYGDVDGSGSVDSSDARMVLQAAVSKITLTEKQQKVANVDGNDRIDSSDARYILQKAVNKFEKFPVEE